MLQLVQQVRPQRISSPAARPVQHAIQPQNRRQPLSSAASPQILARLLLHMPHGVCSATGLLVQIATTSGNLTDAVEQFHLAVEHEQPHAILGCRPCPFCQPASSPFQPACVLCSECTQSNGQHVAFAILRILGVKRQSRPIITSMHLPPVTI